MSNQLRSVHGGADSHLCIELSPWWQDHDGVHTCSEAPERATAYGVYIRNPMAFHVQDFAGPRMAIGFNPHDTLRNALFAAFAYADALADHLGCEARSSLTRPRNYAIEAQRDLLKGTPDGADGSTYFEVCEEVLATQWAVFDTSPGLPGPDLVEDYPSRDAAERAVAALEAGLPLPAPVWPDRAPPVAHREMVAGDIMPACPEDGNGLADDGVCGFCGLRPSGVSPYSADVRAMCEMLEQRGYVPEEDNSGQRMVLNRGKFRIIVTGSEGSGLPCVGDWLVGIVKVDETSIEEIASWSSDQSIRGSAESFLTSCLVESELRVLGLLA